jgi:hypothetical protein
MIRDVHPVIGSDHIFKIPQLIMRNIKENSPPQMSYFELPVLSCLCLRSIKQCCGTVTIYYGSGSGYDF